MVGTESRTRKGAHGVAVSLAGAIRLRQIFESLTRPKRFYSGVGVAPVDDTFEIRLDGRPPRSPAGRPLAFPNPGLADLVANEWSAQAETVDLATMAATRLAHTALDGVAAARAETAAAVARAAGADAVCYFAEHPDSLARRQEAAWAPLLDWAWADLGLAFVRGRGVVHVAQPRETLARIEALAAASDDFTLAGLAFGAGLFASAIITLALWRGRIGAPEASAAAQLEETFQAEAWGADADAEQRRARLAADAIMLGAWFTALRAG